MDLPTQPDDRSPEFARFWWGEAVSGLGTAITTLALQTVVLTTLHGGTTEVGWLNSARWLPYLLLGLVVGALVDRVRRRPVMVVTDLSRAGLLALIPLAWTFDVLSLPLLLVVVVLFGTVSLVNDAASMSFVPRVVPRHGLQRAHARLDAADAVSQTAGPAVAGALIRIVGAPLAVLVDAATYVFSAAMVLSL
ncbi:MFS transporter, partial [Nocardioides sp.]|uniref:MFS transporter n=1 Tax=Nocardioides sp. TaxID=35761 RepID=UPI002ED79CD7